MKEVNKRLRKTLRRTTTASLNSAIVMGGTITSFAGTWRQGIDSICIVISQY